MRLLSMFFVRGTGLVCWTSASGGGCRGWPLILGGFCESTFRPSDLAAALRRDASFLTFSPGVEVSRLRVGPSSRFRLQFRMDFWKAKSVWMPSRPLLQTCCCTLFLAATNLTWHRSVDGLIPHSNRLLIDINFLFYMYITHSPRD